MGDRNDNSTTSEIDEDIADAESAVAEAESAVESAEAALQEANERHEQAKEQRMRMERRLEMVRLAAQTLQNQLDEARSVSASRLAAVEAVTDRAATRLAQARNALEEYLGQSPSAAAFTTWARWSAPANKVFTPDQLHQRLNLPPEQLGHFIKYQADRDPAFRSKIVNYQKTLAACRGPVETHAVQLQVRKNFAGDVAERLVIHALKPLAGEVVTQHRTDLPGGGYTKTDFILKDLKVPVVLGRGPGMSAQIGESLAGEIKCGRATYIYGEKDHMIQQSFGHRNSRASLTICSRDITDLPAQQQDELRGALREVGSPMVGMLPRKEEVDHACWESIIEYQPGTAP